jgi:pterin-4a-carbinolamine dehydratase
MEAFTIKAEKRSYHSNWKNRFNKVTIDLITNDAD